MNAYTIADQLNKFPHEVEELPATEFNRLIAFYSIKEKERKKQEMAQKQSKGKGASDNKTF